MGYIVTAPLVITKREDGSDLYLYQGSPMPSYAKDAEIERLLDGEFIADDKAAAKTDAKDDVSADEKPAGNASLEAWQAYAKSQGKTDDELDGMSRDNLRDLYA